MKVDLPEPERAHNGYQLSWVNLEGDAADGIDQHVAAHAAVLVQVCYLHDGPLQSIGETRVTGRKRFTCHELPRPLH